MENIFSIPMSADPAGDTAYLVMAAVEIQNVNATIERYEDLLKHPGTDTRLRRHYNFCINKARAIRARVVAGINI